MSSATSRLSPITVAIVSFFGFIGLVLAMSAYQMGTLKLLQENSRGLHAIQPSVLVRTLETTEAATDRQVIVDSEMQRISSLMAATESQHASAAGKFSAEHRQAFATASASFAALKAAVPYLLGATDPTPDQQAKSPAAAFAAALTAAIESGDAALAKRIDLLRWFQWVSLAAGALLLAGLVLHLFRNLGQEEQAVATSQQETKHILSTVSEGLFLLDRELKIGAEYSAVTADVLRRNDLAGMSLDKLLADMVPERTLNLALDFVNLLWSDHVEPELVDDINPLGEVEVHLKGSNGQFDTRHLKFGFKRVSTEANGEILVSVTDISEAVQMRHDLEKARAESEQQMDLLMSILHVEAGQLQSFLADSVASLHAVNSLLQTPANTHDAFKERIDSIFRTVHSIKSDSAALGLPSIESKAHAFEEDLQALRGVAELSGRDLLGVPIKLDDLLNHFSSIESLVGRLTSLRSAFSASPLAESKPDASPAPAKPANSAVPVEAQVEPQALAVTQKLNFTPVAVKEAAKESSLVMHLNAVVTRVSNDMQKQATLQCFGLDDVPTSIAVPIKEALVQLMRNAVVHGLETPAERTQRGKDAVGKIRISCNRDASGLEFKIEDDGVGISATRIRETAVAKKLVSADEAAQLQGPQLLALLFRPGFSTAESGNQHAGRGVGLDVVVDSVKRIGGKVGLSTRPGQGTKFTIRVPSAEARHAA